MLGPETFRFLNETHAAAGPGTWNDPVREKLWLYNLHYFDDLNAVGASARAAWHRALLGRWVAENLPGCGNGWEPYPTSLRIVNWIKWTLAGNALPADCLHSLAVQARWLSRRLEYHLLGNHLFANAKALAFAGAFYVGPEARHWRRLGQRLLAREMTEQVLSDGGHFERSPMYHALLLEDVLDLINLAGAYPGTFAPRDLALCRDKAEAMLDWLAAMCHPDGDIGFFNDAAFGIAPSLRELVDYGRRLGVPSSVAGAGSRRQVKWLRESGYVRLEAGPAVALLDLAPIGPDYLPGHAHADTLSFELSLFGQRVIVNGGTSRYGSGPERLAERGTAAHSTVQIDGADSSEVWGGFRVARRARTFDIGVETAMERIDDEHLLMEARVLYRDVRQMANVRQGGGAASPDLSRVQVHRVSAAHDGYRRLPGRPMHRRTWGLTARRLSVVDSIEGIHGEAVARFHLHPSITVDMAGMDDNGASIGGLRLPGGRVLVWRVGNGTVSVEPDVWHPEFGLHQPSRCLAVRIVGGYCRFDLAWTLYEVLAG
jgi:uncharacterized heparinase superfamily protein